MNATAAIHSGESAIGGSGLALPIDPSVTFAVPADGGGPVYSRLGHPTGDACAAAIAQLEGAESCLLANSGMSAISATLLALLKPGEHVVAPESLYATTHGLLTRQLAQWGIAASFVDHRCVETVETALRPETRLIWLESPSNPLLRLTDLEAVASLARSRGVLTVADNTFSTPLGSRPLELGVDVVVHSATKYLSGHGDLLAGAILTRPELAAPIAGWVGTLGAGLSAQAAYLLRRGLYTLHLRYRRHCESTLAVAHWLETHPRVARVNYPGLDSHPQRELALRQLTGGFGGVLSFEIDGDARPLLHRTRLATPALSLGEPRTLIAHPATMLYHALCLEERHRLGIHDGLIRIAVGLEEPEDIIADLEQALA